ncbi:hypothetical protein [Vibrio owensii]|uniref:hypothetical protein n=1 Tax=Vibrio harveyi group TaxID=717610 RepID=UPI003CC55189
MFNLIVAVIAVALITVLSGAALYYGGSSFTDNKVDAEAARIVNEANQINAAILVYKADGNEVTEAFKLTDLVNLGYLKALPGGWTPGDNRAIKPLPEDDPGSEHVCYQANTLSGFEFDPIEDDVEPYSANPKYGIPHCDKPDMMPGVPCCVNPEGSDSGEETPE